MSITFVGGAGNGQADGGDPVVSLTSLAGGSGSAPLAGDLVLAVVASSNGGTVGIVSSGWTQTAAGADSRFKAYYKFMGSTPDTSVTLDGLAGSTNSNAAIAMVFRGVDPATPMDVSAVWTSAGGTGTPNAPSITPVTNGAAVVAIGRIATASTPAAAPTGYSGHTTVGATDSVSVSVAGAYKILTTAAAEDPPAWSSWSGGVTIAASVALRPADDTSAAVLLHLDGSNGSTTFTDETGAASVTQSGGVALSTADKAFGTASAAFDGVDSTLIVDSIPSIGTGPFAIEGKIKQTTSADYTFFDMRLTGSLGPVTFIDAGGFGIYDPTSGLFISGSPRPTDNVWNHFCLMRVGTTVYGFVEGVPYFSGTMATSLGAKANFGANNGSGAVVNGYMDEIRISTSQRYNTTGFTPPTAAFSYGAASVTGTLAATEATDTAAITGSLAAFGTLAATEAKDAAAFTGAVGSVGTLAATEAVDTAAISGTVGSSVSGTLSATEANDAFAASGSVASVGTLAATEAKDAAAFVGAVASVGTLAATEAADTAGFTGTVTTGVSGALAATETSDAASFSGAVASVGTLAATEAKDTATFTGLLAAFGTLAATEAKDAAAFAGSVVAPLSGVLAATEANDNCAITGRLVTFWVAVSPTGETWTAQDPAGSTWTPVSAASTTWNAA